MDSPARKRDLKKAVGLYPCHNQGGNQVNYVVVCVLKKEGTHRKVNSPLITKSKHMHDQFIYSFIVFRANRFIIYIFFFLVKHCKWFLGFFILFFIFSIHFFFTIIHCRSQMYGQIYVLIRLLSQRTCI